MPPAAWAPCASASDAAWAAAVIAKMIAKSFIDSSSF
jgi:hypothetical protein